MISWCSNYSDMASPAVSKDMDFPQTQEVIWGYRSDRVSLQKADLETTSFLSDGINGSAGNSVTYISFRQTSVTFPSTPWANVQSTNYFDKPLLQQPPRSYCNSAHSGGVFHSVVRGMGTKHDFLEETLIKCCHLQCRDNYKDPWRHVVQTGARDRRRRDNYYYCII